MSKRKPFFLAGWISFGFSSFSSSASPANLTTFYTKTWITIKSKIYLITFNLWGVSLFQWVSYFLLFFCLTPITPSVKCLLKLSLLFCFIVSSIPERPTFRRVCFRLFRFTIFVRSTYSSTTWIRFLGITVFRAIGLCNSTFLLYNLCSITSFAPLSA